MPYPQDSDDVERGIETIEGEVSGHSPRDDQFAEGFVFSSPDERMRFEYADGASDALERLRRSPGSGLQ